MSSKTRIIVIRKNQLLLAGIVLLAAVLLLALLIHASGSSGDQPDATQATASDPSATSDPSTATDATTATDASAATDATTTADAAATSDASTDSDPSTASDSSATSDASASSSNSTPLYTPGVYTSTITLNDTALEVQVIVDENHINSISLTNLDETIETLYPLVSPAMEDLSEQIISSQSITGITYSASNQYTSMVLYEAICKALEKAAL